MQQFCQLSVYTAIFLEHLFGTILLIMSYAYLFIYISAGLEENVVYTNTLDILFADNIRLNTQRCDREDHAFLYKKKTHRHQPHIWQ